MPNEPQQYKQPWDYKPFYKMYSRTWLVGSIRFDCNAAERGVYADLLAMANESRNRGVIQANETTPYKHPWLAAHLNIPLDLLEQCLAKFTDQGRISENGAGIQILKFNYYNGPERKQRGRPLKYPPEQLPFKDPPPGMWPGAATAKQRRR